MKTRRPHRSGKGQRGQWWAQKELSGGTQLLLSGAKALSETTHRLAQILPARLRPTALPWNGVSAWHQHPPAQSTSVSPHRLALSHTWWNLTLRGFSEASLRLVLEEWLGFLPSPGCSYLQMDYCHKLAKEHLGKFHYLKSFHDLKGLWILNNSF